MSIELLEPRIAPAVIVNPTTVKYTDIDGDKVTLKVSKPIFKNAAATEEILSFDVGAVDGDRETPQQLQWINLDTVPRKLSHKLMISVSTVKVGTGDGVTHVGLIHAMGVDLGAVTISGDLAEINSGDSNLETAGLASLSVGSFGVGEVPSALDRPYTPGLIYGKAGPVTVKGNFENGLGVDSGEVRIVEGGYELSIPGPIARLSVHGDFMGVVAASTGTAIIRGDIKGGYLYFQGAANVHVKGSILPDDTGYGGAIRTGGKQIIIDGDVRGGDLEGTAIRGTPKSVWIKGSLIGGAGEESGSIDFFSDKRTTDSIRVDGDVRGGSGKASGSITVDRVKTIWIKGSLIGADGEASGSINLDNFQAKHSSPSVRIENDVIGGSGRDSGSVSADFDAFLWIKGSLIGGEGESSANVLCYEYINQSAVRIDHDVLGGPGWSSAVIEARSVRVRGNVQGSGFGSGRLEVSNAWIGGSLMGGSHDESGTIVEHFYTPDSGVRVWIGHNIEGPEYNDYGPLENSGAVIASKIKSIRVGGTVKAATGTGQTLAAGAVISKFGIESARFGRLEGNETHQVLIGSNGDIGTIRVSGDVVHADIFSGILSHLRFNGYSYNRESATTVGKVKIGGDFVASNLIAGAATGDDGIFGTEDDTFPEERKYFWSASTIGSVEIGGKVVGTLENDSDGFGIVAEKIKRARVHGVFIPLTKGMANDGRALSTGDDVYLREIGPVPETL